MARKTARPGRTLVVFFLGLAVAYGLVALGGTWKPALGLDLQGGTRITLIAKGNPTPENLDEAAQHHRPARQRHRRHRGRGDHAGQPVHRRRDPRQEPPRPRRHREAPGAAALPARRLLARSRRPAAASRPAPQNRRPAPARPRPAARRARRPATKPAQQARSSPSASPKNRAPLFGGEAQEEGVAQQGPSASPPSRQPRRPVRSPSPSAGSTSPSRRPARRTSR